MRAPLKTLVTLALLAILGFAAAGCGATKKKAVMIARTGPGGPPRTVNIAALRGTNTIPNLPTGTLVRCRGGPGAKVPRRGAAVAAGNDKLVTVGSTAPTTPSREIQVMHLLNGSVTVTCMPPN